MPSVPPNLLGCRYQRESKRGHVESWFFKTNEPNGRRALWGRCTIFARPELPPVAEAWAIAFDRHRGHIAMKSTVLYDQARFSSDRIDAEVDGCVLTDRRTRGSLSSGRGSLAWDLEIGPPLAAPIFHLPSKAMYRDALPPYSKALTPIPHARAVGAVRIDRNANASASDVDTWEVEGWPVMIGHNWGRGNAELYAWTHCNAWHIDGVLSDDLVFEAVSARVRVGMLLSPMATSAFVRFRGKAWDLSGARALTKNRGSISLRRWEMTGEGSGVRVQCDVAAETDDIVGLHYANPSGPITHCLNTKIARARLELKLPDGELVTATSRAAALEIGTIDTEHGIRMYL